MALNFDPTKKVRGITSSVKIFEDPSTNTEKREFSDKAVFEPSFSLKPVPQVSSPAHPDEEETRNKALIKNEQSINKPVMEEKRIELKTRNTRNKALTGNLETRNVEVIKDEQSINKPVMENTGLTFDKLTSFQRQILTVIFNEIQINPFEKETRSLNIGQLGEVLNIKGNKLLESLRIVIWRLEKGGVLIKTKIKTGRSGWTKYTLPSPIFDEVLKESEKRKPVINHEQSINNTVTKPVIEPPCSSSNLNIYNTTTEDPIWTNLPEILKGRLPVKQIQEMVKSGAITAEVLEDSIWGFAHDLENNLVKSKTGNTTGLFIGALKNGGYISQKYLELKQKEVQDLKARATELKTLRQELEGEQLVQKFEAFKRDFPEQAQALKPVNAYVNDFEQGSIGYKLWLDEFKKRV